MKYLLAALALIISVSAIALPQGKPFKEIEGMIDALAGELTTMDARVTQLETTLAQLSIDVVANADAIAAIEDELEILNTLIEGKQAILTGTCPTGYALQDFDPEGSITCISVGTTVDRAYIGLGLFVQPNRNQTLVAQCPAGYKVTGGTANYAGGIRGTYYQVMDESYRAVTNAYPGFAVAIITAFCIK